MTLNIGSKLGWVVCIQQVFTYVAAGNLRLAYVFLVVASILIYIDLTTHHNYFIEFKEMTVQLRGSIVSILIKKILSLSQYTVSKE